MRHHVLQLISSTEFGTQLQPYTASHSITLRHKIKKQLKPKDTPPALKALENRDPAQREKERQTDRQTDRDRDRQRHTERQRERERE